MKKRSKEERRIGRGKRLILLSLSTALIVFGLWFSTTNASTFLKGYLLYKADSAIDSAQAEPAVEEPEAKSTGKTLKPKALYQEKPVEGDNIGDLYIPKLEATLPIIHGTDEEELEKGVGHFAGSVLPGEDDNSVLSGHRDTVFRELGEVGKGDLLVVTTEAGKFTYKVRQVRIVDEDDRTVIVPKPRATLTVSTCYPFDFVGYAPDRYILVADLISSE
ncbi:sortase A [Planomicrobium koreense]|uniref:Sortase A n=1 Tax=Planococcus koreensis TaxID=112331 RepID=A0A7W8CRM0_9BACL|nr:MULTISPECIES: class D sortase [Planococcus]MBB5179253.1 sortase A [Planococcus koreensis]MDN3451216.1 class D sortase [Planococcus sp. APC 3906]